MKTSQNRMSTFLGFQRRIPYTKFGTNNINTSNKTIVLSFFSPLSNTRFPMLRYHKFTIGHAWIPEFGCSEKEDNFRNLIKYSTLHNVRRPWEDSSIRDTQYPSTMLLTADHDDRVVPLHTLKLLATLQHELCTSVKNSTQSNPIIGRISSKSGHGCGSSTQKMIDKSADCYSFMAQALGASWID